MSVVGTRPMTGPTRSTDTDRTCSACPWSPLSDQTPPRYCRHATDVGRQASQRRIAPLLRWCPPLPSPGPALDDVLPTGPTRGKYLRGLATSRWPTRTGVKSDGPCHAERISHRSTLSAHLGQILTTRSGEWQLATRSKSASWVTTGRPWAMAVAAMSASVSRTVR